MANNVNEVVLRPHRPGDVGWVISQHGEVYSKEYDWDGTFEAFVARIAADFVLDFNPKSDCCWITERNGERLGASFVVSHPKEDGVCKLRMVIVSSEARGLGVGRQLVEACLAFAKDAGYKKMMLWTNDVLKPARKLYQVIGFELIESEPHHSFGVDLVGEVWSLDL